MQNHGIASTFSRDMTGKGWTLVEDVAELGEILVANLELVTFLKGGANSISGKKMRSRAEDLGAKLGQRQAEYLLAHQEEIPEEWQSYYLVFPGTIWRDRVGLFQVPLLRWSGERWLFSFFWFGGDWRVVDRLLRPRK